MDAKQEIARKNDQLDLKDKTINLLKRLCDIHDDEGVSDGQVLISNYGMFEAEHVIKSLFGQFGHVEHIEFYPYSSMAVVEMRKLHLLISYLRGTTQPALSCVKSSLIVSVYLIQYN